MNSKLLDFAKKKFAQVASDLMQNPQGLKDKIDRVQEKLKAQPVIDAMGKSIEDFLTILRLLKAWISQDYLKASKQTIALAILASVYFFTPTDFVPDFILGLGLLDDLSILIWVLSQIRTELDEFQLWEKTKGSL